MKVKYLILIIVILLLGAAGAYWYFFMMSGTPIEPSGSDQNPSGNGFTPFGRDPSTGTQNSTTTQPGGSTTSSSTPSVTPAKIPTLRLLSSTPVGGYGTAVTVEDTRRSIPATTVVRWVDRGRGNVYEARGDTVDISTLSNTVVPKIYESAWNKNLNAFVGSMLPDGGTVSVAFYAELRTQATSTATAAGTSSTTPASDAASLAPFLLKGQNLPQNTLAYAVSPGRDKVFMLVNENGGAAGYISSFDGKTTNRIFETPLTQLSVEWPEENTLALTTKSSADLQGFLYFVNPKTGLWKKILGPQTGLMTTTSTDGKYVLASTIGLDQKTIRTTIYNLPKGTNTDAGLRTLADKCVWGNFYKDVVYCATPTKFPDGIYPNDWYKGSLTFIDKIWQVSALTGEVHLVSNLLTQADRVIDAYRLGLDKNDNFLVFINKNDLSLWSLDLVAAH